MITEAPTRAEAFVYWQEAVPSAVPLPPRKPRVEPEPDVPDEPPSTEVYEETRTTRISTGDMRISIEPRFLRRKPKVRPENVPAVVLPLAAAGPIPTDWAGHGFTGRARLVGEHGHIITAFVCVERAGSHS